MHKGDRGVPRRTRGGAYLRQLTVEVPEKASSLSKQLLRMFSPTEVDYLYVAGYNISQAIFLPGEHLTYLLQKLKGCTFMVHNVEQKSDANSTCIKTSADAQLVFGRLILITDGRISGWSPGTTPTPPPFVDFTRISNIGWNRTSPVYCRKFLFFTIGSYFNEQKRYFHVQNCKWRKQASICYNTFTNDAILTKWRPQDCNLQSHSIGISRLHDLEQWLQHTLLLTTVVFITNMATCRWWQCVNSGLAAFQRRIRKYYKTVEKQYFTSVSQIKRWPKIRVLSQGINTITTTMDNFNLLTMRLQFRH